MSRIETVADFLNGKHNTPNNIFIDGVALLAQHNQTQGGIVDELGVTIEEVERAAEEGQLVEVPAGNYAIAQTKNPALHEQLKDDISFDERGIDANRIKRAAENETVEEQRQFVENQMDFDEAKDTIRKELRAAGFTSDQSVGTVALFSSMAQAQAQRDNKTPAQWLKENAVKLMTEAMAKEQGINLQANLNQPVNVKIDPNATYASLDLSIFTDEIGATGDNETDFRKVTDYIKKTLTNKNISVSSADLKLKYSFDAVDKFNRVHVSRANSQKGRSGTPSRIARNITLSNFEDILQHSVLVEINNNPTKKKGRFANKRHQGHVKAVMRAVMPVTMPSKYGHWL